MADGEHKASSKKGGKKKKTYIWGKNLEPQDSYHGTDQTLKIAESKGIYFEINTALQLILK